MGVDRVKGVRREHPPKLGRKYHHHTATKSHLCIPFLRIARPQSQFSHKFVCERFYIPGIDPHISCSRIGRSIVGIYHKIIKRKNGK